MVHSNVDHWCLEMASGDEDGRNKGRARPSFVFKVQCIQKMMDEYGYLSHFLLLWERQDCVYTLYWIRII